ncbi:radical SAM/SPASM domain-containing protein [Shinella sp.]|uniref:radical SAM/SPASM domain-containing protein n=1 Tax=Shinella sp. TaxID=1870904 RepID=UPI0029A8E7DF|nr:radical SAM protein [Shinella sp.]MDX3977159.1 SPASM domain-containing protein [Shinella sp.]
MRGDLTSVNLSLSSACGADCVFCPSNRGKRIPTRNMSFDVAKKIIDEMASDFYQENYNTVRMQIGENGDCFINRNAIEILRYAKKMLPHVSMYVFTDAQFFSEEKIEVVMREGLLDFVAVNVDGASAEAFQSVKRMSFQYVQNFLPLFVGLREKYSAKTQLVVESLTMRHYVDAVTSHLGHLPIRLAAGEGADLPDDFVAIRDLVKPFLRQGDYFGRSWPTFWAERSSVDPCTLEYSQYVCPSIDRVQTEAFIAPDGTWYGCCLDSDNELVLGNVFESSLHDVAQGPARNQFISMLLARKFGEIGGPCATVNCCQIGIREPIAQDLPSRYASV